MNYYLNIKICKDSNTDVIIIKSIDLLNLFPWLSYVTRENIMHLFFIITRFDFQCTTISLSWSIK